MCTFFKNTMKVSFLMKNGFNKCFYKDLDEVSKVKSP